MPNWCNNYITISGENTNMKPIYDFINENKDNQDTDCLLMNGLVPHDEEYQRIKDNGEFIINPQDNFYGTKWDISMNEANLNQLDEDCITLGPQTAWSPPSAFCERLSKKYGVRVRIEFDEPGIGFIGVEEYDNGEMTEQIMYDNYLEGMYYLQPDSFWESEAVNTIEYSKEEEKTFDDMYKENFRFITEESEINELKELWEEL